jgi:short-subunit dehydrogenase
LFKEKNKKTMNAIKRCLEFILFPPIKVNKALLTQRLHHKTVLITGATFGIGEALCYQIADIDCRLILVARTTEKLETIKQQITSQKATVHVFSVNLSDEQQLNEFIKILSQFTIDIFINNAGKSICRPIMQSLDRYHDFQRTMQLNYFAPVKLCLALIPELQKNKGQIINVSAINVLLAPTPYWAAYQASKTAFDQWLNCASSELAINKITVSSTYLPLVKTRMIAPTKAYQQAPAMRAEQAAMRINNLLINRKTYYKPWWSIWAQLTSVLLYPLWLKITQYYLRNKK